MNTAVTVFCIFNVLFLTGCVTGNTGTRFEADMVSKIQRGTTKRSDIENMFGPPANSMPTGNGQTVMIYSGTQSHSDIGGAFISAIPIVGAIIPTKRTTTIRQKTLQITLDRNNVVQDVQLSDNTSQTETTVSMFGGHVEQKNIQPEK